MHPYPNLNIAGIEFTYRLSDLFRVRQIFRLGKCFRVYGIFLSCLPTSRSKYHASKVQEVASLVINQDPFLFHIKVTFEQIAYKKLMFSDIHFDSCTEMSMSGSAPVITIDGPSGVGKGVISRLLADRLGWRLLDSGALYRLLALDAALHGVALDDESALSSLGRKLDCEFLRDGNGEHILLHGHEVTMEIRSETCGGNASQLASLLGVREVLLMRQREFRSSPGLVADGRDMGTNVFPDADVKIFLTASSDERARRRHKQLKEQGTDVNLASLLTEISERDRRDRQRSVSPLRPAIDAVLIDTTDLDIDTVLSRVMSVAIESGIGGGGRV
uniref:Cytidylate kinase n=1 Tax=Candidatus Kentrum sp. TUN TaxID=2126343 RepID=A0A450ZGG0_9GAMM|nr:MAG: cytidylate kinase [Candidatus Kentron sp. TUN]VFK52530.1 MAG: cytidylate kinase [Candidatus Kentron sp. TUN]VFK52850.1 MAG: cytidylate kinase [Candidatus Kentron sp. TUN]